MPVLHEWDQKLLDLFKDMPTDPRQFMSCKSPTWEDFIEVTSSGIFDGHIKNRFHSPEEALDAFRDVIGEFIDHSKVLYWRVKPEMALFEAEDAPCDCSTLKPMRPDSRKLWREDGRAVYENPNGCKACNYTGHIKMKDHYHVYARFLISDKPQTRDVPFEGDSEVSSNG